jgi:hypothetical protein
VTEVAVISVEASPLDVARRRFRAAQAVLDALLSTTDYDFAALVAAIREHAVAQDRWETAAEAAGIDPLDEAHRASNPRRCVTILPPGEAAKWVAEARDEGWLSIEPEDVPHDRRMALLGALSCSEGAGVFVRSMVAIDELYGLITLRPGAEGGIRHVVAVEETLCPHSQPTSQSCRLCAVDWQEPA